MGAGDLLNEVMCSEQRECASSATSLAALFGRIGGAREEGGSQIAVAEALEDPFAAGDGLEQLSVGRRPRVESTVATSVSGGRSARVDGCGPTDEASASATEGRAAPVNAWIGAKLFLWKGYAMAHPWRPSQSRTALT